MNWRSSSDYLTAEEDDVFEPSDDNTWLVVLIVCLCMIAANFGIGLYLDHISVQSTVPYLVDRGTLDYVPSVQVWSEDKLSPTCSVGEAASGKREK